MKKISPHISAMAQEFMAGEVIAQKKLKVDCYSYYGFVAKLGFYIRFLTPKQLAIALQISTKTLERWRKAAGGPPFVQTGNSLTGKKFIRYPIVELDKWVKENLIEQDQPDSSGVSQDSSGLL